ncbi:hypothetical protein [Geminocystis sp.]|uniref:hypothetical protein n=1 Tax=Geminocystis sp. TaxID=2664100 RepID=UPI00359427A9
MNIPEMLEFIDEVMEDKTGKVLTDLQRSILEGTLKGEKYSDIGDKNGFTEGHVRDVGYQLLQLLSNIFDKPLHKRNLKQFLETQNNISNSVFSFGKKSKINYSNVCREKKAILDNKKSSQYQFQLGIVKKLKNKGLSDRTFNSLQKSDAKGTLRAHTITLSTSQKKDRTSNSPTLPNYQKD